MADKSTVTMEPPEYAQGRETIEVTPDMVEHMQSKGWMVVEPEPQEDEPEDE